MLQRIFLAANNRFPVMISDVLEMFHVMISGVLEMFPVMISKVFEQDKLFLDKRIDLFSDYFEMYSGCFD